MLWGCVDSGFPSFCSMRAMLPPSPTILRDRQKDVLRALYSKDLEEGSTVRVLDLDTENPGFTSWGAKISHEESLLRGPLDCPCGPQA